MKYMNNFEQPPVLNQANKIEDREEIYLKLKELLKNISTQLNQQFNEDSKLKKPGNLLDDQCRLRIKSFQKGRRGGNHESEDIKNDQEKVLAIKTGFGSIDTDNEKVIEYYRANAKPHQRIGAMLEKMDFDVFKAAVLG